MSGKKSISGPYRATKLWNDAVRSFYNGMPVSRHWRGLRQYDRCFTATEAVDWLHQHLQTNPNFGRAVSRDQTIKLLRKFVKAGLLEDVRGVTTRPEDFREGRDLYRFSSRSPLKALRTPGRTALAALDPNTPQPDLGSSPLLRRHRSSLRQSARCKRGSTDRDASPTTDPPAPKAKARRAASLHRGDNAANERRAKEDQGDRGCKDQGGMQECHLVARPPTVHETNQVWKEVLLNKLDGLCERLVFGDVASVLEPRLVCGESVRHNMTQLTGRGVVKLADGHPEDLPNWILTAMKCLAQWPNVADSNCNIPNYPGVERDVFKIVRDFFINMAVPLIPYELYEPLIRLYIGAEFLDITHRSHAVPASTSTSTSGSSSPPSPPLHKSTSDTDSVEDLILNMSLSGQATSTPHGEERAQGGPKQGLDGGSHTPHLDVMPPPEASRLLLSLKLRRLRDYTDFKDDSLYPVSPLCQASGRNSCDPSQDVAPTAPLNLKSSITSPPERNGACQSFHKTPPQPPDASRPVSRQSGAPDRPGSRGPDTVRSVKTSDQARRLRQGVGSVAWENMELGQVEGLDSLALPNNCCFETAFTSDSPKTRIIPQKSVDSLHFRRGERQRPRSLAAPPLRGPSGSCDSTVNYSSASDLFRSSIVSSASTEYITAPLAPLSPFNRSRSAGNLQCFEADFPAPAPAPAPAPLVPPRSLAGRIRDSIKRKHLRDDSLSRKRGGRGKAAGVRHLRTESGGYLNLGMGGPALDDAASTASSEGLGASGARLAHLRTKSGGFLNLALAPSGDSTDTLDSVPSAPMSACSDPGLLDNHPTPAPIPQPISRPRILTPDGCLSHSLHSSASGNSLYHSALSHTSRGGTPTSLASHSNLASPSLQPVSGMAGIYSATVKGTAAQPQASTDPPGDLHKQLSSSANELSDRWADRTPQSRALFSFERGGGWRHCHSSPSKRRIGYRRGAQVFWGSKACVPGLLTREGREAATTSARLLLLLLAPVRRRKLHLLLRMMSKMAVNDSLSLDSDTSTRALVLNTFARSILLCGREADHDEVLALRVVAFLMDTHEEVMRPPEDLAVLAHRRLALRHRSQVVYAAAAGERSITLTYCRQVSPSEYQRQRLTGSQLFLAQLLDQLVENTGKLSAKERKRKLKEFKSLYPEVYRAKFPEEEPQKVEGKSRMKSLIKLASLTSLGRSRQMKITDGQGLKGRSAISPSQSSSEEKGCRESQAIRV